ncbi:heterogeneous nuclear ribonucleoprotein l-like protein [Lasius niger]|uniref:Heterogeneous nuclear ribonucleoprotein l-like protein n=1 Tax=Lasius niger TaxID=67767 RepID=A0A0J7LAG3_LASNI|nr:heterogeneous nuclear ribonucleoprotein l-like protein [Lasius niger]
MVPGSTPQVTFPPGAGHDRYEENFNGPATYAEPYVERYGIKSDFSGREPLHPTPPRPGYVPTLGQTPPSSTQGSVMMVYGLQPDKVNTDKLFNLFCLYGNVTKMGDSIAVERCLQNLNNVTIGTDGRLQLGFSKQAFLSDVTNPYILPDKTASFKDFTGSKNNRRQLLKLIQEANDSKSTSITIGTSNESIDFRKSVELFPDTMDSKVSTQTMQCLESIVNTGTCYESVEKCEDNNNFVIDNGLLDTNRIQKSMPEGRRIVDITCYKSVEKCEDNNNFVIDNGPLDTNRIQESMPEGRRIVDITCYESVEKCEDNNNFVIDNGPVDTNRIQESMPEGRRIVDISFLWNEIHRTFDNHARGIECQFKDWKLVSSRRRGLMTQLFFKCQMCNYEANIWSEPTQPETLDVNTAAVAGTVTMGIGYAQLEELCAAINVPCMSEPTYVKYRENLIDDFNKTAMENMKMAGEVEKQLALERNDVINGIPYITVVADGSWMKRSYGNAYNSLSGIGAIIGYHTKKILFVGVRNKFCAICDVAERIGIEPKAHKCYKNFDRNASSTSMESDVIMHGQLLYEISGCVSSFWYIHPGGGYITLTANCGIYWLPSVIVKRINKFIFEHLRQHIAQMNDKRDKLCVLMWDEMSLEANLQYDQLNDKIIGFEDWGHRRTSLIADHVLVFMARGIWKGWKILLCYSFCKSQTKSAQLLRCIKEIIKELTQAGLTIIATVCDQRGPNMTSIKKLLEDSRSKCIQTGQEYRGIIKLFGQNIVPIYDPPHLLKGIRNNLLYKNLEINTTNSKTNERQFASWDIIELAYKMDINTNTLNRQVPKLTDEHVIRSKIKKMKVKCAAQVFSGRLSAYIEYNSKIKGGFVESQIGPLQMPNKEGDSFTRYSNRT